MNFDRSLQTQLTNVELSRLKLRLQSWIINPAVVKATIKDVRTIKAEGRKTFEAEKLEVQAVAEAAHAIAEVAVVHVIAAEVVAVQVVQKAAVGKAEIINAKRMEAVPTAPTLRVRKTTRIHPQVHQERSHHVLLMMMTTIDFN